LKIPCNVILDLIPIVKDGVASRESAEMVREHIEGCKSCRAEYDAFEGAPSEQPLIRDEKIVAAIKRSIFITQLIILGAGAALGIGLSNSMDVFYNILLMPAIGGFSLLVLKKKWYLAPAAVFILTFIWQIIAGIILDGFRLDVLRMGLYYSVIYTILVGLGEIIAALLKFAFKKEVQVDE